MSSFLYFYILIYMNQMKGFLVSLLILISIVPATLVNAQDNGGWGVEENVSTSTSDQQTWSDVSAPVYTETSEATPAYAYEIPFETPVYSDWTYATPSPVATEFVPYDALPSDLTVDPTAIQNSVVQSLFTAATEVPATEAQPTSWWDEVTGWFTESGSNTAAALAIVNSGDYSTSKFAPWGITSIFGTGLATGTQTATTLPLPTQLAGAKVFVDDFPTGIFFASPTQINFVIPPITFFNSQKIVTVRVEANGVTQTGVLTLRKIGPAFFTANSSGRGFPAGYVVRTRANGTQVTEAITRFDSITNQVVAVPITVNNPGETVTLVLFGTGIRGLDSTGSTGNNLGKFRISAVANGVSTLLNNRYAGEVQGLVGLDQVNVDLPASLAGKGTIDITSVFIDIDDRNIAGNTMQIAIR